MYYNGFKAEFIMAHRALFSSCVSEAQFWTSQLTIAGDLYVCLAVYHVSMVTYAALPRCLADTMYIILTHNI